MTQRPSIPPDVTSVRPGKVRFARTNAARRKICAALLGLAFVGTCSTAWLGAKAITIREELGKATELIPVLQSEVLDSDFKAQQLSSHTLAARNASEDPLWTLASAIPFLGGNLTAIAEVARSADDLSSLAVTPLVGVADSLSWDALLLGENTAGLDALQEASPIVSSAAHAVRVTAQRLEEIDASRLLPQISEPLGDAREQLMPVTEALDASAAASQLAPAMLGADTSRNYLLIIQNNAESRASGGIPGALAVLNVENGQLSLRSQSSAAEVGVMAPPLPVESEQQQIYSKRMGRFLQDVNLTPDFPTAASTAQSMWERKTGQTVDGVISLDPVALSYILDATGPVLLGHTVEPALSTLGLPTELRSDNVVQTLLSDVYSKIGEPRLQDAYFADVARKVFSAVSNGASDGSGLFRGLTRGAEEGRVLVWSDHPDEQNIIAKFPLSGSISGSSVPAAQFGVYFNDGTGAKMDFYVKRTVQLVKQCVKDDGYEQTAVRITSTNTAPADAAASLPAYVTGGGVFGVPPGTVQTNIVAYGPAQAQVETAKLEGQKTEFAPYFHAQRPVGVLAIRLAPGESKTVEFTFGEIVQHTEPNVVVTPTVQDVKDVTLPTETDACG
jgi:hypothetical protein